MLTKAILRDAAAHLGSTDSALTRPDKCFMCHAVAHVGPREHKAPRWLAFYHTLGAHGVSQEGDLAHKSQISWREIDPVSPGRAAQSIRFMFLHLLAESGEFYRS